MIWRLIFWKLIAILLLVVSVNTEVFSKKIPFFNLNVENGLVQSQTRTIVQDEFGYLWIGTLGGLSRFDGQNFTNYTTQNGLNSNSILSLANDKNNHGIWIGSNNGLNFYDGKSFSSISLPSNVSKVISKLQVVDNQLWFLAARKLHVYTKGKFQAIDLPNSSNNVISFWAENANDFYVATNDKIFHQHNKVWDSLMPNQSNPSFSINEFFIDANKRIWVATNFGLFKVVNNQWVQFKKPQFDWTRLNNVLHIAEDYKKQIWLSTTSGVVCLNDSTIQIYSKHNGLCDNVFIATFQDKEGSVWLASDGQGVFRYSESQFTSFDEQVGLSSAQVMCFAAHPNGTVYMGTYNGGLFAYQNNKVSSVVLPTSIQPSIIAMKYYNHALWLGTRGSGLWRWDGKKVKSINTNNSLLRSNVITALHVDNIGRLWVGSFNGFGYMLQDSFHQVSTKNINVLDFTTAGNDSLLIASTQGIWLWQSDQLTQLITNTIADKTEIQCLLYKDGNIWLGTSENGLLIYNLKTKKSFSLNRTNGLQSDFIYHLSADDKNNVWIGTGYGIYRVKWTNSQRYLIDFYGKKEGVKGMESNHNAVLHANDGSIWFGTIQGAIQYRPEQNNFQNTTPKVALQSVRLLGESQLDSTWYESLTPWYHLPIGLKLPYKKNNLNFEFKAVSLSNAEQIRYRYMLEGLNAPWTDWSTNSTATFSALPSGNYRFRVQVCLSGNVQQVDETTFIFQIVTPFHKTNWFRLSVLFCCILIGTAFQYIVQKRKQNRWLLLERLRKEEQGKVRQRTAEDFHDEVGNRLTRINVLTNVLRNKLKNEHQDTQKILDKIEENTQQLYSGTRDILWSLNPNNDSVYEILLRISDFGSELFADTDIHFQCIGLEAAWSNHKLPMDWSRNLIMIFKEALNNTLKYAAATEVSLAVSLRQDDVLQLVLTDNGKGFDRKLSHSGHGLQNMQTRAERLNGKLYIDSRIGKGTILNLTFKIPKEK